MSSIYVSEQEKRELDRIVGSIRKWDLKNAIIYSEYEHGGNIYIYAGEGHDAVYYLLPETLIEKVEPVVRQVLSNVNHFYLQDFLKHFCPELAQKYYQ